MPIINTGCPILEPHGKSFRLSQNYVYKDPEGNVWLVPVCFVTDLASIPLVFFWWHWGRWHYAAILHDHGYAHHGLWKVIDDEPKKISVSRDFCDRLFYKSLLDLGVSKIESKLMYWAVKVFGRWLW